MAERSNSERTVGVRMLASFVPSENIFAISSSTTINRLSATPGSSVPSARVRSSRTAWMIPSPVPTRLVSEYVAAAQIGKKGSCHIFRHTMATLMLEGGADIRFIQAMLGHAKLDTTMVYTQVSIRMLKQVHAATHPAKLGQKPSDEELEDGGTGTTGKVQ